MSKIISRPGERGEMKNHVRHPCSIICLDLMILFLFFSSLFVLTFELYVVWCLWCVRLGYRLYYMNPYHSRENNSLLPLYNWPICSFL